MIRLYASGHLRALRHFLLHFKSHKYSVSEVLLRIHGPDAYRLKGIEAARLREAFLAGVPLLDLRLICDEDADYANDIEPSVAGGEKITSAILKLIAECDFLRHRTEVFK